MTNNKNIVINPQQNSAITDNSKIIRVIAGAGTGKTTILINRILYLITERNIDSRKILVLTFTNQSLRSIKSKIQLSSIKNYLDIFTYHGFCFYFLNILKNKSTEFKNYYLIFDRVQEIKKIIKEQFSDRLESHSYKIIEEFIANLKKDEFANVHSDNLTKISQLLKKKKFFSKIFKKLISTEDYEYIYYEVFYKYILKQINNQFWDFDDLIIFAIYLLKNSKEYVNKKFDYQYIFADEFQDTNYIQYKFIKLLMQKDTSLFVVGDPDQCIYEWRDAKPDIILNKMPTDFNECKTHIVDLNYRSTNNILKASNMLIKTNYLENNKLAKTLKSNFPLGNKIKIYKKQSNQKLVKLIAEKIKYLKTFYQYNYSDIVILYRYNYMTYNLENYFNLKRIPYVIYKGKRFLDRKVNKQIFYFLAVLNNLNSIFLEEIINIPPRKIGIKTIEKIKKYAFNNQLKFNEVFLNNYNHFFKKNSDVEIFINSLKEYSKKINMHLDNPAILLKEFLKKINFFNYVKEIDTLKHNYSNNNINALKTLKIIEEYFWKHDFSDLTNYINEMFLYSADEENSINESVNLMTIHSSKGLEFKAVFLLFLENDEYSTKLFNTLNSEERRVYYVSFTRAIENLYVFFTNNMPKAIEEILEQDTEGYSEYFDNDNNKVNNSNKWYVKKDMNSTSLKQNIIGKTIIHPIFGDGEVLNTFFSSGYHLAEILFKKNNKVLINVDYISNYCKIK